MPILKVIYAYGIVLSNKKGTDYCYTENLR